MSGIGQYFQETRAELRHVAWPTRMQTIVYTVMVALLSVGVALYLGFFDFIFTTTLTRVLSNLPSKNPIQTTQQTTPTAPSTGTTQPLAPINQGPLKFAPSNTNTNVNTSPTPKAPSNPSQPSPKATAGTAGQAN